MAKYRVEFGHRQHDCWAITVYKKGRLRTRKVGEAMVSGEQVSDSRWGWRFDPPADSKVRYAALRVIADYEFPRPEIELCQPCKEI